MIEPTNAPKPNGILRVCVTGAAGQIAYSLLSLLASGQVFGPGQRLSLSLLEIPVAEKALLAVVMELEDGAYPLVESIDPSFDAEVAFKDCDVAILVGAFPRRKGMERKELLSKNAGIFRVQGDAMSRMANRDVKVVVVGNPANTNALILSKHAPSIAPENISALTRLDHNRVIGQIVKRCGATVADVQGQVCIWGNHSTTQYPDVTRAQLGGKSVMGLLGGPHKVAEEFIPLIQTRGARVIEARGSSSAMSAANAIADHMRSWMCGDDHVVSMAVPSDGSYGVEEGVYFSYPVKCPGAGKYEIVQGIELDEFSRKYIDASAQELYAERDDAMSLLA